MLDKVQWLYVFCGIVLVTTLSSGCGMIRGAAMNSVADALAGGGGTSAFATDDDPELVREALPFGLKTYESLLLEKPEHRGLLLAAGSGFIQYAGGFLHWDAERLEGEDFHRSLHLRNRSSKLYLRGRDYCLRALDLQYPGIKAAFLESDADALGRVKKKDVDLLFWSAAGWGGAISTDSDNMALVAQLPTVEAMMARVLELDESYDSGSAHEFLMLYEHSRAGVTAGSGERVQEHFDRAVSLSGGLRASPYVAAATTLAVQRQDVELYRELLQKALAIDVSKMPEWRLSNTIAQQQAAWYLAHIEDYFLITEE